MNDQQENWGRYASSNQYKNAIKEDFPDTGIGIGLGLGQDSREFAELSKTINSIVNGPSTRNGTTSTIRTQSKELLELCYQQLKVIQAKSLTNDRKNAEKEEVYELLSAIRKANAAVDRTDLKKEAIAELNRTPQQKGLLSISNFAKQRPRLFAATIVATTIVCLCFPPAIPFVMLGVAALAAGKLLQGLSRLWSRHNELTQMVDRKADHVQHENMEKINTAFTNKTTETQNFGTRIQTAEAGLDGAKKALAAAENEMATVTEQINNEYDALWIEYKKITNLEQTIDRMERELEHTSYGRNYRGLVGDIRTSKESLKVLSTTYQDNYNKAQKSIDLLEKKLETAQAKISPAQQKVQAHEVAITAIKEKASAAKTILPNLHSLSETRRKSNVSVERKNDKKDPDSKPTYTTPAKW